MSDKTSLEYDVALSFAREDRPQARELAKLLAFRGVKLFYDEFEEANLWGKDLAQHLHEVYAKKALYCIPFISMHYAKRAWPRHEIKASLAEAVLERPEYILPIKVDGTEIPGLAATVCYVDLREKSLSDIADLCCEKLRLHEERMPGSIKSKLRLIKQMPMGEIERLDVKVKCPMCGGEGFEWVDIFGDAEKDFCRMDCEHGKTSFFDFLQWMWTVYNARRNPLPGFDVCLTDGKVEELISVLYNDFQKHCLPPDASSPIIKLEDLSGKDLSD